MKKLLFLILLVAAAWYGYKNYPQLMNRAPGHSAVISNQSDNGIRALRFTADGQTQVKEDLPSGQSASFDFKVNNDSEIRLEWEWTNKPGERRWVGGRVSKGPLLARHEMQIVGDGEVNYRTMPKQ
jgi:hypothetical protein